MKYMYLEKKRKINCSNCTNDLHASQAGVAVLNFSRKFGDHNLLINV